jgi:hypothetical protein
MADILAVDRVKEAFTKGKVMDRIQDIGLTLSIVAS